MSEYCYRWAVGSYGNGACVHIFLMLEIKDFMFQISKKGNSQ